MSPTTPTSPFKPDTKSEATDQQLVAGALAGSQQDLETLIDRHQPWIYNLAFRMVMVREDAEDVTQEVLVKVITKLAGYDPDRGAFRTWLYRIVINHIINMKTRGYEASIPSIDDYYARLLCEHPFYTPPGAVVWLRQLLEKESLREFLQLDESEEARS